MDWSASFTHSKHLPSTDSCLALGADFFTQEFRFLFPASLLEFLGLASEVVTALREGSAFAAKEAFRTSERSRASSLGVERERLTNVAKATSDGGAAVAVKLARSREGQIYEDVEAELRLLHAISKVGACLALVFLLLLLHLLYEIGRIKCPLCYAPNLPCSNYSSTLLMHRPFFVVIYPHPRYLSWHTLFIFNCLFTGPNGSGGA